MSRRSSEIKDKVFAFTKQENLLNDISIIYIGFSGGCDSTALVVLFKEIFKNINVVHFNHGIRGKDSGGDELWCRTFCKQRDIPFDSIQLNVPTNRMPSESIEMAARRLRLTYWKSRVTNQPGTAVMLAHHIDDKFENFFIRLSRGSNSSGLTGLRNISCVQGVTFLRPLLCLEKTEIIEYLHANKIFDFRHDKSNTDLRYKRNQIRHRIIPLLLESGLNKKGLLNSLNYIEGDAKYLELLTNQQHGDSTRLTIKDLLHLDFALWPRELRIWKNINCGNNAPIKGSLLKNLKKSLTQNVVHGAEFALSDTHNIKVDRDHLILQKKEIKKCGIDYCWDWIKQNTLFIPELCVELIAKKCDYSKDLNLNEHNCQYWNHKQIGSRLHIRQRKPGDRLRPFAIDKNIRVKKLIANAKLSVEEKQNLIIICNNKDDILWIPFVRRSNIAIVTPDTPKLVKITYNKLK